MGNATSRAQHGVSRERRFDADGFYSALDAERLSRQYTWRMVAGEAGVSASTLTRMAQGRRPDVDSLAALVAWSGISADGFVQAGTGRTGPGTLAMISTYLRSDPHLTPEAADALDEIVKVTYGRMRRRDEA